jgi:hypothetical protein
MMNEHAYINARLRQASKAMNLSPGPLVAIPLDQLKYLFYPDGVVIFTYLRVLLMPNNFFFKIMRLDET